jgi:hypothetical protein
MSTLETVWVVASVILAVPSAFWLWRIFSTDKADWNGG